MISKKTIIIFFAIIIIISIIAIFLLFNPIPQPQSYHHFADQRTWFGIPNTLNVLSNIPLALAGIWGLFLLGNRKKILFVDNKEKLPWMGISIGLILTAIYSSYYHLVPNDARLVFDRISMTIVFMSLVTVLIQDRISFRFGLGLWPILLALGIYSVLHWYFGELQGTGDLRLYMIVQGYTVLIAFVMLFLPSHYTRTWELGMVIVFYGLAKIFEMFDWQIYHVTHRIISGHTLKHLFVAMAALALFRMLAKRKIKIKEDYE
jgi:hypothetical protein